MSLSTSEDKEGKEAVENEDSGSDFVSQTSSAENSRSCEKSMVSNSDISRFAFEKAKKRLSIIQT